MCVRDFGNESVGQKLRPRLRSCLAIVLVAGVASMSSCFDEAYGPRPIASDENRGFPVPSISGELSTEALMKPGYLHNRILAAIDRISPLRSTKRLPAFELAGVFAEAANRVFEEEGEAVRIDREDALRLFEFFHRLAHDGVYDILHSDLSSPYSFAEFAYEKGYFSKAQAESLAMFMEELRSSGGEAVAPASPQQDGDFMLWCSKTPYLHSKATPRFTHYPS